MLGEEAVYEPAFANLALPRTSDVISYLMTMALPAWLIAAGRWRGGRHETAEPPPWCVAAEDGLVPAERAPRSRLYQSSVEIFQTGLLPVQARLAL